MNITVTIAGASNPITLSTEGPTAAQITNALGYTPANPTAIPSTPGEIGAEVAGAAAAAQAAAEASAAAALAVVDAKARSVAGRRGDLTLFWEGDIALHPYFGKTIPDNFENGVDFSTTYSRVDFATNITSIGNHCFYYGLIEGTAVIPDSCTSIGAYAFAYCPVEEIIIGSGILTIGKGFGMHNSSSELKRIEIHAINCPALGDSFGLFHASCEVHVPVNGIGYASTFGGSPVIKDL